MKEERGQELGRKERDGGVVNVGREGKGREGGEDTCKGMLFII